MVWSCWTLRSCWTFWLVLYWIDYVEPNGHVELFFKIVKSGLVMLNPMVMLNFLVVLVLLFLYCIWSCTVLKFNLPVKNILPRKSSK